MARPISFFLIVMCCAHFTPPPPYLLPDRPQFDIFCNAEGPPEERGRRDRPHLLKQSSERPYHEEHLWQRKIGQDIPSGHRYECF